MVEVTGLCETEISRRLGMLRDAGEVHFRGTEMHGRGGGRPRKIWHAGPGQDVMPPKLMEQRRKPACQATSLADHRRMAWAVGEPFVRIVPAAKAAPLDLPLRDPLTAALFGRRPGPL